jgi:hypothetical protein
VGVVTRTVRSRLVHRDDLGDAGVDVLRFLVIIDCTRWARRRDAASPIRMQVDDAA